MGTPRLIIFDGDDTLWLSEVLYDQARAAAAEVVAANGINPIAWDSLQRTLDVQNAATMGLSPERFPLSCRQAFEELAPASLEQQSIAEQVHAVARTVFESRAELVPDATAVLKTMSTHSELVLLTKGDARIQSKRIVDSGLGSLFDTVQIVASKSRATFEGLAHASGARPGDVWSVGNSVRSDVLPAIEAGMTGIWVDAHVWELERHDGPPPDERIVQIERLKDLLQLLNSPPSTAADHSEMAGPSTTLTS